MVEMIQVLEFNPHYVSSLMKIFIKISCPKQPFCILYKECNCRILMGRIGIYSRPTRSFPNSHCQVNGATNNGCFYQSSPYSIRRRSNSVMLFCLQNAAHSAIFNLCTVRDLACHFSILIVLSQSEGGGHGFPVCGTFIKFKKWFIASLGTIKSFSPFFPFPSRSVVMLPLTCFLPVPSHGAFGFSADSEYCF